MTYRVVPLESAEAGDARLGVTAAERLEMVQRLSRLAWASSGRALPRYSRRMMPIRLRALIDQGGPDDT